MRRWGFAGLGASHGVSVSHRSPGSTGQRQVSEDVKNGNAMIMIMIIIIITYHNPKHPKQPTGRPRYNSGTYSHDSHCHIVASV